MNTAQAMGKYAQLWSSDRTAYDEQALLDMRRNFARRYLALNAKRDKTSTEQGEAEKIRGILIDRYMELQRMPNLMENESSEYKGLAKFLGLCGETIKIPLMR